MFFTKILLYYAIYRCQGSLEHSCAIRVAHPQKKEPHQSVRLFRRVRGFLNCVRVGVVAVHYPAAARHRVCGAADFGEHPRELLIGGFVGFSGAVRLAENQPRTARILRPSCGEFNLARPRVEFSPSVVRLQVNLLPIVASLDGIGAKFFGFFHLAELEGETHSAEAIPLAADDFHIVVLGWG